MGWKCVNHFKTEIIITKNKKIKVNKELITKLFYHGFFLFHETAFFIS